MQKNLKTKSKSVGYYVFLIVLSVLMVLPLIWMLLSALKSPEEIFAIPLKWFPEIAQWANFKEALELAPLDLYLFNSTFTAFVIVIFHFVLSCMIAYALTQMEFKGRALVFNLILVTYMLPPEATYVSSYTIIAKLWLFDTLSGVIIYIIANVFSSFLIRMI